MCKEITMSINQFMDMERGNISLGEIVKINRHPIFNGLIDLNSMMNLCLTFLIIGCTPNIPSFVKDIPSNEATLKVTKEGLHALYITSVVCAEYLYILLTAVAQSI